MSQFQKKKAFFPPNVTKIPSQKESPPGFCFHLPCCILGHFFWTGSEKDYEHIPAKSTSLQRQWGGIIQLSVPQCFAAQFTLSTIDAVSSTGSF